MAEPRQSRGGGSPGTALRRCLAAGALVLFLGACASAGRSGPAAGWAAGPVRWLMLPEEERQFRRLHSGREAVLFIELFWRRRDPTPTEPGNPFLEVFHDRVQAADRLYGEEETRGSLTDRGRVLILLGPPPVLRHRRTAALQPLADPKELDLLARAEQSVVIEEWEYPPEQLSPQLLDLLDEEHRRRGVVLGFVQGEHHTRLAEGGDLLLLAARALATQPLVLGE